MRNSNFQPAPVPLPSFPLKAAFMPVYISPYYIILYQSMDQS